MARAAGGRLRTFALSALLAFAAGELSLRAWNWYAAGTPFFALLPGAREAPFPLSPFLAFGPRIDWQMPGKAHPETAYWNAQGFRTHDVLGPRPANEVRVIALGSSTTEDVWNEAGIHWPLVAEQTLHAAGRDDVRIYNGAMSAYTSAHTLVRLELDVLQYEPDLVLVSDNVNDLRVVYAAANQGVPIDASYRVKYARKRYTGYLDESDVVVSRLVDSLRVHLAALLPQNEKPRPPLEGYDLAPGLAIFERNLRSIVAVARANGADVVFVTLPASRSEAHFEAEAAPARLGAAEAFPTHERFLTDLDRYNDALRQVGAGLHVPVIDAAALLPPDEALFSDLVHTTTAGARALGAIVGTGLEPLLPPRRDGR